MSEYILESIGIKYRYPHSPNIFDFTFNLTAGQFVIIVGKSGSGKSTLVSLISGFLNFQDGSLIIHGKNADRIPPHNRDLAVLFQSINVFHHLKVFDNVALGISPNLKLSSLEKREIFSILEELHIIEFADRKVQDLSGGQQQRVAIARCLIQKKSLILLDEPFSALEPNLRKDLLNLLAKKAKEFNKTVLMVTHFPQEVREIATNVLLIEKGSVYKNYSAANFFSSTDPFIKEYLMDS